MDVLTKRLYTFDSTGRLPERATIEEAARDWGGDLPTCVHWTDYDERGVAVAQGNTAIEPPFGTVVHWGGA